MPTQPHQQPRIMSRSSDPRDLCSVATYTVQSTRNVNMPPPPHPTPPHPTPPRPAPPRPAPPHPISSVESCHVATIPEIFAA